MMHEDKEKGMGKRYRMEIEAKARLEHLEKPWHVDNVPSHSFLFSFLFAAVVSQSFPNAAKKRKGMIKE